MSKVSIQGDASGTGTLTIAAPNTNSNYTLTLPEATGTMLTSAGGQTITKSADTVQTLNRTTSDGTIAEFQKDGTTVGSIGSNAGTHLTMGSGDTGLLFNPSTDKIHPWNMSTGGLRDNAVDLGVDVSRFKDLYLSGGVYLGGTGAANYLDDYETGTWTPEFEPESGSFSSITYSSTQQIGRYIKVGKQVTCLLQTNTSSISLGTAAVGLKIIGLPFTPTSGSAQGSGFCNVFQNWGTTPDPIGLFVSSTSAVLYLRYGNNQKILPSTLRTTNDSNQMWAVITYTTA